MADVNDKWYCPYAGREIYMGECDDYNLVGSHSIRDDDVCRREDIPKLLAVCEKCPHCWGKGSDSAR